MLQIVFYALPTSHWCWRPYQTVPWSFLPDCPTPGHQHYSPEVRRSYDTVCSIVRAEMNLGANDVYDCITFLKSMQCTNRWPCSLEIIAKPHLNQTIFLTNTSSFPCFSSVFWSNALLSASLVTSPTWIRGWKKKLKVYSCMICILWNYIIIKWQCSHALLPCCWNTLQIYKLFYLFK